MRINISIVIVQWSAFIFNWTNRGVYEQIKDERAVITRPAARPPSSCQRRHPPDREHSQQGVPATSQIPCWKMRLTLKLHSVPTKVLSCSFIFLRTVLMNPSCFWVSQLGAPYLASDQSHAKHYAGASYAFDQFLLFFFIDVSNFWDSLYVYRHQGSLTKLPLKDLLLSLQTPRTFWISKFERWANYLSWKISLNATNLFSFTCLTGNISTNSKFRVTVDFSNWFRCRGSKPRRLFSPSFLPPDYSGGFMCSVSLLMHCPHWLEAIGFRLESFSVPSASRKKGVI